MTKITLTRKVGISQEGEGQECSVKLKNVPSAMGLVRSYINVHMLRNFTTMIQIVARAAKNVLETVYMTSRTVAISSQLVSS